MSGLARRRIRGHHKDQIDITTTDVAEAADGSVTKTSSVNVAATDNQQGKDLWIGFKVGARQYVLRLTVGGAVWVQDGRNQEHKPARQAFESIFAPGPNERWAAFQIGAGVKQRLRRGMTRSGVSFDTELKLSGSQAKDPNAQTIPIAVCYAPADVTALSRKDILLGHSLVQAPPTGSAGARGRRRRPTQTKRRRRRRS